MGLHEGTAGNLIGASAAAARALGSGEAAGGPAKRSDAIGLNESALLLNAKPRLKLALQISEGGQSKVDPMWLVTR